MVRRRGTRKPSDLLQSLKERRGELRMPLGEEISPLFTVVHPDLLLAIIPQQPERVHKSPGSEQSGETER
jgi:hypothetical protein